MHARNWTRLVSRSLLLLWLAAVGCSSLAPASPPTSTPKPEVTLTVSGSGTVTAILAAVQPALEADLPGFHFKILPGSGTSAGIKGILDGSLDLVTMARTLKDDEAAQGLKAVMLGKGGVGVIVHPDLAITNLSKEQVKGIFFGQITNWSQVGGPDQKIIVYVRDEDEAATQVLRESLFGTTPFPDSIAKVFTNSRDMQTAVSGTKNSIGFGTWPGILAVGRNVKAVAVDNVLPKDPAYPFMVPLGVGYLEKRQAAAQPLIVWLASEAGRAALRKFDVIVTQ